MRKLAILSLGILTIPAIAIAVAAPKYFVCKYTGKPGVNEVLQTGQNPISVSENAIKDFQGVGSYFNDAQGRSYVLEVDNGQPEPNVSKCPQPTTPPPTPNPTPNPTPTPTPPAVTPAPTTTQSQTLGASTQTQATEQGNLNPATFVGK